MGQDARFSVRFKIKEESDLVKNPKPSRMNSKNYKKKPGFSFHEVQSDKDDQEKEHPYKVADNQPEIDILY